MRSVWLAMAHGGRNKKRSRTDPSAGRSRSSERAVKEASSNRANEEPAKPRVVCAERTVLYDERTTRARERVARLREVRVMSSELAQRHRLQEGRLMPSEVSFATSDSSTAVGSTAATVVDSFALSAQSDEVVPTVSRASRQETMDAPHTAMVMCTASGQEATPVRGDATLRWGKVKARVRITLVAHVFVKTLVDAAPRRAAVRAAASRAAAERVAAAASRGWRTLRRIVAATVLCNVFVRTLLELKATAGESGRCQRPGAQ